MEIQFEQDKKYAVLEIFGPTKQVVKAIAYDSRKVQANAAFFCIIGEQSDGHDFIDMAVKNGATVIFGSDRERLSDASRRHPAVTFLLVNDTRLTLARISIDFNQNIDQKLYTIGVTGTNGKTTVAAFVRSLLTGLGLPAGSIGTTGIWTSEEKLVVSKSTPTTPEAPDLHETFALLWNRGDRAAVMEVSSIAIEEKRTAEMMFDVAIHTNFSPEHLEYHGTVEAYREAKLKLFDQTNHAVVNIDDKGMAAQLLERFNGSVLTYSLIKDSGADLIASNSKVTKRGTSFELSIKGKTCLVHSPVFGEYNVANLLSAMATAMHLGFTVKEILRALPSVENPEGRFEVLRDYKEQTIILDYAHTPVALKSLLTEVKKMPYNRLIVMIAGIGIRDFGKMPHMAQTIDGQADEVIVTVDHPGDHDPAVIIDHVCTGFQTQSPDTIHRANTREDGVLAALSLAQEGDVILLTSGCINGAQFVKGEWVPHSDEDIIAHFFSHKKDQTPSSVIEA